MDKPCYFNIEEDGKNITDNCGVPHCKISKTWKACKYGKNYKSFVKFREKVKLAKAREISVEIQHWLENRHNFKFPFPQRRSEITKIILKNL